MGNWLKGRKTAFISNLLWNWGDNFLFIGLEDETTMGLFKLMGRGVQWDFVDFQGWLRGLGDLDLSWR